MTDPQLVPLRLHLRTGAGQDGDGNDTIATDDSRVVQGKFAPGGSTEARNDQTLTVTQPTAFIRAEQLPADLTIDAVAEQLAGLVPPDGHTYDVDGRVANWGVGLQVPLRRTTG